MEELPFEQPLPVRRGDLLDVTWNWSKWLRREGGQIASFSINLPQGITKVGEARRGPRVVAYISVSSQLAVGAELELMCSVANTSQPPRQEASPYKLIVVG